MVQCALPYRKFPERGTASCVCGRVITACGFGGLLVCLLTLAVLRETETPVASVADGEGAFQALEEKLKRSVADHEAKLQALEEKWKRSVADHEAKLQALEEKWKRSVADHEAKLRVAEQYFQREAALSGVARNASNQRRNETFHGVPKPPSMEFAGSATQLQQSMVPSPNVALGAPVRVTGGRVQGAPPVNLFDGEFVADGTGYNAPENVFWTDPNVVIEVNFWAYTCVTGIILQADNNDKYKILLDGQLIADVWPGALHSFGSHGGLSTWPFPKVAAMVPFTCGMSLILYAHGGDSFYSVQELTLMGFRSVDSSQTGGPLLV